MFPSQSTHFFSFVNALHRHRPTKAQFHVAKVKILLFSILFPCPKRGSSTFDIAKANDEGPLLQAILTLFSLHVAWPLSSGGIVPLPLFIILTYDIRFKIILHEEW